MGTWFWRTVEDKIRIEEIERGTLKTTLITELDAEQRQQANALVNHHNRDVLAKRRA